MKRFTTQFTHVFAMIILTFFLFTACNNPVGSEEEEHSEPFGIALISDGVEIAAIENGVLTYREGDYLELGVGEETSLITVRFIDEEGDRFEPDTGDGYSLHWDIDNESVLEIEQHEEDGAWSFHFVGAGAGEAGVIFELWHNNHTDYQTPEPIKVHVQEAASGKIV